jgi:hypothetical protein
MLCLLASHNARWTTKFNACIARLSSRQKVPCSVLVRTHIVDNFVARSIVDMLVCEPKASKWALGLQ